MATAVATGTVDDVLLALSDDHKPLADVLAAAPERAWAQAWARGDIEFGRVSHCVTGRPGVPASNPTLLIEDGIEWTGAKTPKHAAFSRLLADSRRVPECAEYKRYVKQELVGKDEQGVEKWRTLDGPAEEGRETRWTTARITRAEAVALLGLYVRLTDKGMAAIQAA